MNATVGENAGARHSSNIPDYGFGYFRCLLAEYSTLAPERADPKNQLIVKELDAVLARLREEESARQPSWSELAAFEILLLRLLPSEVLRRKTWIIRDRYRDVVGPVEYAVYVESQPPSLIDAHKIDTLVHAANAAREAASRTSGDTSAVDVAGAPTEASASGAVSSTALLRADLENLLGELHLRYGIAIQLARLRQRSKVGVFFVTLFFVLVGLGFLAMSWWDATHLPTSARNESRSQNTGEGRSSRLSGAALDSPSRPRIGLAQLRSPTVLGNELSQRGTHASQQGKEASTRSPEQPRTSEGNKLSTSTEKNSGPGETAAGSQANIPGLLGNAVVAPLLCIILVMGALGGCTSVYRRMSAMPIRGGTMSDVIDLRHGWLGVLLAPVYGAVFALVLYLVFAGDFIQGPVFPGYLPKTLPPAGTSFADFLFNQRPAAYTDVAKVLVWSFLAGFGEQLVPDVLDRIVAQGKAGQNKKPPL